MQPIRKEIISIVSKLISFKTIDKNLQEINNCIDYIQDYFSNSKLIVKKFTSGNIPSLVISNQDTKSFDILFNGHIDVVPGTKKQFTAKVTNLKIFGRGAIDMKGSIASLMVLFKNLPKINKKVGLMIVSDEEINGTNGTNYLVNKKVLKSKFTIIAEESDFNIVTKQKGQITIKLKALGKSGHGSQPWAGENAIEKLYKYYLKIRNKFPQNQTDIWNSSSINLGVIAGGEAVNVIPNYAEAKIDIRYPTIKRLETLLHDLKKITQSDETFMINSKTNPMNSGRSLPYINKLKQIIKEEIGRKSQIKWTNYCSDGRYFSDKKLPVIEFGPTGENYHTIKEYVEINSLVQYYNIINKLIESI
ncbi:MAG: M20/M25/M40 family metallo-hydrolase [Candidatus Beckwithbacteria bacterium]|nr:M20/M25/M40 family metallo-hydrolase [Patescibacteria group bacterium]